MEGGHVEQGNDSAENSETHSGLGKLSVTVAILGLIAFFLPWLEVSCGGLKLQLSGYEIATGRVPDTEGYKSFYNNLSSSLKSKRAVNRSEKKVRSMPNPQPGSTGAE